MRLQLKRAATLALACVLAAPSARAGDDPAMPRDRSPEPAHRVRPEPASAPLPEPAPVSATTPSGRPYDVHLSSEIGGYADTNHVFVVSPTIAGHVANPTAGWSLDGRYLVDVVSAASVDIVATASPNFREVRHVGNLGGSYKPGDTGISASVDVSREPDYTSITAGGAITQDLLHKNLTLLLGYSHGHDIAGRRDTPFSVFARVIDIEGLKGGATMVLGPATVLSVVGDAMFQRGNTAKPYRYVPMFAPGVAVPVGASVDVVNQLRLTDKPLEQTPTTRNRFAVSGRLAHRTEGATFRLDERVYTDSWGLDATTTDARILFDVGRRVELGPHARFHIQSPVSFWQRAYTATGGTYPTLRTGDRELGPLWTLTGGGRVALFLGPSEAPRSWTLGLDLNLAETKFLDDVYITNKLSAVGGLSLEVDL